MHHPPTASSHPFLSLSLELKHAIFGSLPDVRSLFSVILTCRSFYHAFLGAPSLLLKIILQRQIAPEVAFDALVAFEASKLGPSQAKWSKRQVKEILALYTGNRSCLWSRQWDLQDALEFSRLRDIVKFFATGFVTTALSRHPTGLLDPPATTLRDVSPAELHRIQRTIYRFDLYCNLFKKKSPTRPTKGAKLVWAVPFTLQEQQAFFFERFSVWENEQLACVHDFLDECLSIPFNDVAQHDIGWGELGIEWVDRWYDENNGWKEGYLTRGLGYLHQLVHAPTYEARYKLLSFSDMEKLSLYDGLIQQPQSGERPFSEYSPVERDAILNHPCPADSDKGPRDAWLWAHQDSECHNLYNARYERHAYLRKCGYVMWDAVRWRDWGLLDTEWDDCRVEVQERENLPQDITSFVEVQESWKVRSQIHARGGKGWWAPGDLSRVVWRSGKPPDDWPPKEIKKEVKKGKKDKWQVEAPPPREKSPELPSDLAGWSKFFEQKAKTSRS